ncbi:hypothetical protein [Streptomonospora salina]|uniref:Uncharacterized protein n=1 Tax=Streptomonospora salina TaxID=104205 RepID=A0A841ED74_9ACTN|nr:hypothetical protein [Streptomonospora salina]MBB5997391.1 hypothetical protein [Streptomonospora salina]
MPEPARRSQMGRVATSGYNTPVIDATPSFRRLVALPALLVLAVLAFLPSEARADVEPPATPAQHYADRLAEEPEGAAVVVDQASGGPLTPAEMTEGLHTAFGELGLPYYVVVTPFLEVGSEIAPALHDRLGADGVYAVLEPQGTVREVESYGTDADTGSARHVALTDPDLDYNTPATEVAEVLVAALKDPSAAEQLQAERERPWPFRTDAFAGLDPSRRGGPESLGFLLGAVGGTVVAVGVCWGVRSARRGRLRPAVVVGAGSVLVAAVVVSAPAMWVAAAPTGDHEKPDAQELARMQEPYVLSTGRVEHIVETLGDDPLYVDPLVGLPREGLDGAADEFGGAPVPVYAAVVPLAQEDESGGDHEVLAAALAAVAQREGVYLVAGSVSGDTTRVGAATYGLGAGFSFDFAMREAEAAAPADALSRAVTALDDVELTPGGSYTPGFADREPSVPAPRMERYWSEGVAPGFLVFGLLVAPAAIGLGIVLLYARRVWRGGGTVVGDRVLRRLAGRETARLRALLARGEDALPEALLPQADAALLTAEARPRTLDLLGVVVLARRTLAEAEDPRAAPFEPCGVNPLHPWATERTRTPVGRSGKGEVCARCSELSPGARSARVLRLRSGGTAHAYDADPDDPWIRHGFGADDPAALVGELLKERPDGDVEQPR